jgi:hypothetical protein
MRLNAITRRLAEIAELLLLNYRAMITSGALTRVPGDAAHWPTPPLAHLWQQWASRAQALSGPPAVEYRGDRERRSSKPCDAPPSGQRARMTTSDFLSRIAALRAVTIVIRAIRSALKKNTQSRHWIFRPGPNPASSVRLPRETVPRRQEFRSVPERTGLSFHRSLTGDRPSVFSGRRAWSSRRAVRARFPDAQNARRSPRSRAGRSTGCP